MMQKTATGSFFPLTFMQQGILVSSETDGRDGVYLMQCSADLLEPLDAKKFREAWEFLVARHEILRTTFWIDEHGVTLQSVHPHADLPWRLIDWSDNSPAEQARAFDVLLKDDMREGFGHGSALFRLTLVRLDDCHYKLVWTSHYATLDARSLLQLLKEVFFAYESFQRGGQPKLPPAISFRVFAEWVGGRDIDASLKFWASAMQGVAEGTSLEIGGDLAAEHDGAASTSLSIASHRVELPASLTHRLRKLCHSHEVTLNTLTQATWAVLLSRYTGQETIVFGATRSGRGSPPGRISEAVGPLITTVPVPVRVDPSHTVSSFLKPLRRFWVDMRPHEHVPLHRIREVTPLAPGSPWLESLVAFEKYRINDHLHALGGDWPKRSFRLEGPTHYPLVVSGTDGDPVELVFSYDTARYSPGMIGRMAGHFVTLLEGFVAGAERQIGELPLLREPERQQVVSDWNQTKTDYPRDQTVQALFEEQVAVSPDAIAIEYEGNTLSYAQLNERANQLAHYLRGNGVGPEVMVGISIERSLEMVVGLLGIVKAGGAYLPLDPDYPLSRLDFMLQDAGIKTILTTSSQRSQFPLFPGEVIYVDTDWPTIAEESSDNPISGATPDNLLYVIYTSGSTGQPKGTLIEHRSAVRLVKNTNYVELGAEEVFLQFAPIAFDASTFELWGSLLNGARLVIFPAGRSALEDLGQVIEEKGVTTLWLTSALFSQMVDNHLASLSGIRQLLAGGEALSLPHVKKMVSHLGENRLINGYGPTENTTFTCCHAMTRDSDLGQSVPIGRPISNTTVYILDARMNPVPVGIPGELYIGGDGLARGYLNQPEMTAQKFVADPFSDDPQARLYATGDQVRYRLDGSIEFIGRIDHQVKLRGYRIELGEIETVLVEHSAVDEAVAMVREDEPGDKRIAAYLVASPQWVEHISSSQSGEHVDDWQALYEETYGNIDESQDLTTNFTGWNSSYTGEPIPLAEMEEWQESTVVRIAALQPGRVLEIGCGTGLLLFRLAPECERYVGTDFSAVAQRQLRGVVSTRDEYKHVELWQRTADDFSDIEANDFDTVIINSVTQHLPSMDYLADVVEGAIAAIADGGRIMLGDIRSLPLLKAYHTSVQLYLSPDDAGGGELLRNIQQHVEEENELVIEPAFFHALKQRIPRLSHVEILLKRGQYHNELSGYRYDVILHVEAQTEELSENGQWLDWGASALDEDQLAQRLEAADQEWLGINAMPNARVSSHVEVLEQLQGDGSVLSVGELRQNSVTQAAVEPDDLWQLAEAAGYQLELSYSGAGTDGRMDALFRRSRREDCAGAVFWPQQQDVPERAWSAYGTNPLKGRLGNELIPLLRQDLQQQLPEYMMPSVYVLLDALPLNPNGKVERKALPVPGDIRASLGAEYTAPRNEMEQQLAAIWAEVLKLERVGIHDDFFALGGHSLLATQLVARIERRLGWCLSLASVFDAPTLGEMAEHLENLQVINQGTRGSHYKEIQL